MTNESDVVRLEPIFYVRRGLDGIEIAAIIDGVEHVKQLTRGAAWNIAITMMKLLRELEN
jgi:hypothetical protein